MHLVIFEGSKWHTFAPLSLSRPVFALGSGTGILLDKQVRHLRPSRLTLWVRPELAEWCLRELAPRYQDRLPVAVNAPLDDEMAVIVSGRTLHFSAAEEVTEPCAIIDEEDVEAGGLVRRAVVRLPGLTPLDAMTRSPRWQEVLKLPRATGPARMASYVWDLLNWNEEALVEDFVALQGEFEEGIRNKPAGPYHVLNGDNVWIGPDVRLDPGVVLDGGKGPVMIGAGSTIGANAVLRGPCSIAPGCHVKPLSLIECGTSVGPVCKVGGEIKNSILLAHTNKSHDGYLGDSYVGEWVNLGAGTVTSNLKNTYGPVKVRIGGREVDSGRRHLGSLVGDHTKTAVGTRLMTGSYIGYCAMLAASAIPPTFVPSFSFLTDRGREAYRADKALEVMRAVHARRGKAWPEGEEARVRYVAEAARAIESEC